MRVGEYLLKKGLITRDQLKIALMEQEATGEKVGEILVRFGFITRDQLIAALSEINPSALIGQEFGSISIPPEVLLENKTVVLGETSTEIFLASIGGDASRIKSEISKYLEGNGSKKEIRFVEADYMLVVERLKKLEKDLQASRAKVSEETDVNLLIRKIIEEALERRASDIHIESSEKTIHVRYRIDGILHIVRILPKSISGKLFSRIKDMSGMDVSESRLPQDGSFSISYKGRHIDFRVASIPGAYGEKITMRILDKEKAIMDIRELGITLLDDWLRLSLLTTGMILVCGPTGSGKTTTLYSTISLLDKLHKTIYTIEDPIEYRLPFITQVQVNRAVGLDYASFIRTVLRHDPDIVIVGEIRDTETARNAVRLAETGHLVYATLHTNDVPSSISRLLDLGADLSSLSLVLRGILVQKLIRKICPDCGGRGCRKCEETGYRGRTLLTEFAVIDDPDDVIKLRDRKKKYYTFLDDAIHKLRMGVTDVKEMERVLGVKIPVPEEKVAGC